VADGPFFWGVATSAYQIEGNLEADGRGASIWDDFRARKPKRFKKGASAEPACDHYRLWESDLELIADLGVNAYRFSIAWPRLFPDGAGTLNEEGARFYDRLIEGLLARGVTPFVTLYHWDLPLALEREGGWTNRAIVGTFVRYVEACVRRWGDKVKHWIVLNEGITFTGAGHFLGLHAPGRRFASSFLAAVHHALLAQGEAVRAIKAIVPDAEVGTAAAFSWPYAHSSSEADARAAARASAFARLFVDPVLGLGYADLEKELPFLSGLAKVTQPGDLERIACPIDFVGVNHYFAIRVAAAWYIPYARLRAVKQPDAERTALDWEVAPQALRELLVDLAKSPGIKKLYVTENGAAYHDERAPDGSILDGPRISYLRRYIQAMQEARAQGVPVAGYFVWSLLDSFEWTGGYEDHFGLYHVDRATQTRTLKASGAWYRTFLRETNAGLRR
jgi:beta-glucosidase